MKNNPIWKYSGINISIYLCLQAVLDSLLLHSVSQLSTKIRHSVDKTAGKIR